MLMCAYVRMVGVDVCTYVRMVGVDVCICEDGWC